MNFHVEHGFVQTGAYRTHYIDSMLLIVHVMVVRLACTLPAMTFAHPAMHTRLINVDDWELLCN